MFVSKFVSISIPQDEKNLFFVRKFICLFFFVWVEALRPSQQFFSHVGTFSCIVQVLRNGNEVSCSRTQHHAPGEIRTRDLAFKSPTDGTAC